MDASNDNEREVLGDPGEHGRLEKVQQDSPRIDDNREPEDGTGLSDSSTNGQSSSGSEDLGDRGIAAAKRFLKNCGYEISPAISEDFDIVAIDTKDKCRCFINVCTFQDTEAFIEAANQRFTTRADFEQNAIHWIIHNDHEEESIPLRYDEIDILVFNDRRALLRHNKQAI